MAQYSFWTSYDEDMATIERIARGRSGTRATASALAAARASIVRLYQQSDDVAAVSDWCRADAGPLIHTMVADIHRADTARGRGLCAAPARGDWATLRACLWWYLEQAQRAPGGLLENHAHVFIDIIPPTCMLDIPVPGAPEPRVGATCASACAPACAARPRAGRR